ncbi:MAG: hypothetical protein R8K47_01440 [Mariprofundaceae bacterium]
MNRMMFTLALAGVLGLAMPHAAMAANPCNPCAMKPMNPCHMDGKKAMNPCHMGGKKQMNPCHMGGKKQMNPCHMDGKKPMNPCHMDGKKPMNPCHPGAMRGTKDAGQWGTPGNTPIREHAFDNFQQAVALGKKMWRDDKLGTSGVACLSCHGDYQLLHFDRRQNFPHFVKMVGDVVTLDQMINYCMLNPMKGKAFAPNSKELTAMAAYYRAYRMQYLREHRR